MGTENLQQVDLSILDKPSCFAIVWISVLIIVGSHHGKHIDLIFDFVNL